jgi:hypothetical protein
VSYYRTGRHLGRTVYKGDELIGVMDTPELGALVVDALNAHDRYLCGVQGCRKTVVIGTVLCPEHTEPPAPCPAGSSCWGLDG